MTTQEAQLKEIQRLREIYQETRSDANITISNVLLYLEMFSRIYPQPARSRNFINAMEYLYAFKEKYDV